MVSAVIVTRGDVDLQEIQASLPFDEVVIWDNSQEDRGLWGRYQAVAQARHELIYTQDDDVVVMEPGKILESHDPGFVTSNIPYAYRDGSVASLLVGFGAVFERDLATTAFARFEQQFPEIFETESFVRTCDLIFMALTPQQIVHRPIRMLPCALADNRMWRQPTHTSERQEMLKRIRAWQAA